MEIYSRGLARVAQQAETKAVAGFGSLIVNTSPNLRPRALSSDLAELQISAQDLPQLISELLKEIHGAKPHECYRGRYPPLPSIEPEIQNEELWEYAWHSQRFNKRMYLKFVLKKQCYIHVRCHEDRPPETLR